MGNAASWGVLGALLVNPEQNMQILIATEEI